MKLRKPQAMHKLFPMQYSFLKKTHKAITSKQTEIVLSSSTLQNVEYFFVLYQRKFVRNVTILIYWVLRSSKK